MKRTPKFEPKEAFNYQPPNSRIKGEYDYIFNLNSPIKVRFIKLLFDKLFSLMVLLIISPLLLCLLIAYIIEGKIIPENKGPILFYYNAVSAGKTFRKYKIRLIKMKFIDKEGAKNGDWHAYSAEWTPESRTYVGGFVKKYYLDELPQFYNVLTGDMSIVGPRPLAIHHYERDIEQGNITRSLIKGGLIGLGHILKGTPEMGKPIYEYEYIDQYLKRTSLGLLWLDFTIILKGVFLY
jgi:lipopolysaccharide/colanic/teichoic acid biosynthesis glycosyltransferase